MRDQHEEDTWDQDTVEIEDLGAPDNKLIRYLFALGEKWHIAAPLRTRLVTPLVALCLLIAVLQPASSGANSRPVGTPHTVPGYSVPSTIYIIECVTTNNISSHPGQAINWQQVATKPSEQGCSFSSRPGNQCPLLPGQQVVTVCSVGRPLPARSGNAGKNH